MAIIMKRFIKIFFVLLIVVGCDKITSINNNPKSPTQVPGETLFSNAEKNLSDFVSSTNVNLNIFKLMSQYWTETTYFDESNYDIKTRAIPDNEWDLLYRDVLENLQQASTIIKANKTLDAKVQKNEEACVKILNVYAYSSLVNIFGNVPYSQALNYKVEQPKYDDANTIYKDLLDTLNTALGNLDPSADGFGSADLIYGGDVSSWVKFGNSLKLRLGMTIVDADPSIAQAAIEQAAPKAFASNADNALFQYLSSPPNTNPLWVDLVQSGRQDFVAASPIVDMMNTLNDPRRQFYFTTVPGDTVYKGGIVGASNAFSTYSHPGDIMETQTFPGDLLDYSEVEFLRAEAVARGFNVSGTAEEHYKNAIEASILAWGGSESDFQTYYAQPAVSWSTATGNYKQKIGTQEWIALYGRGLTAWTTFRRLDYPALKAPPTAKTVFPMRFTYPVQEQNLNKTNFDAAVKAMGMGTNDNVGQKLFWDKY